MTAVRTCVALAAVLLGAAVNMAAQEPAKIRANVNLVNVSFVARDARGALVDQLKEDDIEVLEDSAPQKIAFFAKSADVPLTLGLIVDASGSQEHFSKKHEKDLEVFLKRVLGPQDRSQKSCGLLTRSATTPRIR